MRNESHFFLSLYQRSHVNRGSTVSTLASPLLKADSSFLISRASLLPFSRLECRKYETIIPGKILTGRLTWVSKMLKIKVLKNRTFRVFHQAKQRREALENPFPKIAFDINDYLFIIVMPRCFIKREYLYRVTTILRDSW